MPLMLVMGIGWWEKKTSYCDFVWSFLYPNKYHKMYVLGTDDPKANWQDKKTGCFTAICRYFTTFMAGTRGLIDMASDENVAKRLTDKKVPKIYTKLLSLCALLEE